MRVLTLNAGSNSLKFEAVDVRDRHDGNNIVWGTTLLSGTFENIGKDSAAFSLLEHKKVTRWIVLAIGFVNTSAPILQRWTEQMRLFSAEGFWKTRRSCANASAPD
jgi:acetate kinase